MIIQRKIALISIIFSSAQTANAWPCSDEPRDGIFVDSIQATSDPSVLAAQIGLYETTSQTPVVTKRATIDLQRGSVTDDWPEGAVEVFKIQRENDIDIQGSQTGGFIEVFPNGLHNTVDMSGWTLDLEHDLSGETVATIVGPFGHTTGIVPRAAAVPMEKFVLQDIDILAAKDAMFWFISEKFQRAYLFYNNATRTDENDPPAVTAILPLTGEPASFIPYTELVNGSGGHANDDIQVASVPASVCGHSTAYYTADLVEVREGLFNLGRKHEGRKMALAHGPDLTDRGSVYKIENKNDGTYEVTGTVIATGEEVLIASIQQEDVSAVIAQQLEFQLCPKERPSSSDTCSGSYVCSYGVECCCGKCHDAVKCACFGGNFMCSYTEACYRAKCEDDTEISYDSNEGKSEDSSDNSGTVESSSAYDEGNDKGADGNIINNIGVKFSG